MSEIKAGDTVRVRSGAFASFAGKVEEVAEGGALKVAVTLFGRKTVIELSPGDVEKVSFTDDRDDLDSPLSNN
jgi:transcription antitermination factor NusG